MLRIRRIATGTAANSDAPIDLETGAAVRVDQFHRGRAFPLPPVFSGIDVVARMGIQHVLDIGHQ